MKNFKIIHDRKNITREESSQLADFESLLNKYQDSSRKRATFWRRIFWATIALIAVGLISIFVYQSFNKGGEINSKNSIIETQSEKAEEIKEEPIAEIESNYQHQEEVSLEEAEIEKKQGPSQNFSNEKIHEEKSAEFSFKDAKPIIGFPALYQYFDENLVYPESLVKEQIEGKVVLNFVIDTLGRPADISVEIPLHYHLDSLAIEIIDNMPTWFPAELNGKPISSKHRIPLTFQIEKEEKN